MGFKYAAEVEELGTLLNQTQGDSSSTAPKVSDEKVKWSDELLRFEKLDMQRQLAAANRLSSSQLSTLIDIFQQAKVTVLKKEEEERELKKAETITSMLELLAESGLTPHDLINAGKTKEQTTVKQAGQRKPYKKQRYSAEAKEDLKKMVLAGKTQGVIQADMKRMHGLTVSSAMISNTRKLVKEEQVRREAAQQ